MKKAHLAISTVLSLCLCTACSKSEKPDQIETNTTQTEQKSETAQQAQSFDINQLPNANISPDQFPYISLPEGYAENGPSLQDYEQFYFAIQQNYHALEGKLYKVPLSKTSNNISEHVLIKSFEQNMQTIGAQKLNDTEIPFQQTEKIAYTDSNIELNIGQKTYTYGFKNNAGQAVIAQLSLNSPKIVVMELKPFEAKMQKVQLNMQPQSDELAQSIAETGKAIVHINFAVDSAKIEASSQTAIHEIVKLLQQDPQLKLSIDGHTDNTGLAQHNLKLSESRAEAVKNALIQADIQADRLQPRGLGASQPIADNTTDEGKALNRRVELVKIQ
ncbi:OmpA family protein [Acinetobacter sp. A2]|uniref:OmpA family protein n=1 Tax=Acinetobacter sp. A2 TaxID=362457 RepID=UPI003AF34646